MGRKFDIPSFYRSPIISRIKSFRQDHDSRKKDLTPSTLDIGKVRFKIARHFGFCFGVENAIEIAFRALSENPNKRIFLLSEMIHNPSVNRDLQERGVQFLQDTNGGQKIPFEALTTEDIVIVPAFGTTVELMEKLTSLGINPQTYDATCPFVEKVWNRAAQLGSQGYTIVIHGKHYHEETRATFSHARQSAPSVVIRDMKEAELLACYIRREKKIEEFYKDFEGKHSVGFNPESDLIRIGVVNQTTMLAGETQKISDYFRDQMSSMYGRETLSHHIADTRDTLCYATAENQNAIQRLVQTGGDLAIVVGGYNSSNTSHLAKICSRSMPTYYIQDASEIISLSEIRHMDLGTMEIKLATNWWPTDKDYVEVLLSAGASSPDSLVDEVVIRVAQLCGVSNNISYAMENFSTQV